ncbi:MAG: MFS transporter [Lysobacterales bacterium]
MSVPDTLKCENFGMTVGFDEAGSVPAPYAFITDYFPPGRRGMALGIINLGPPTGATLGIAFGASSAVAYSWRNAFILPGMCAGILTSSRVIERNIQRSKQACTLIPAVSLLLVIPLYVAFVWAPTWQHSVCFLIGPMFLNFFYLSSAVALVHEEVRPDRRVMSGALLLLVMNFIGLGLGSAYVHAASVFFRQSQTEHSLQIARYTLETFYILRDRTFSVACQGAAKGKP